MMEYERLAADQKLRRHLLRCMFFFGFVVITYIYIYIYICKISISIYIYLYLSIYIYTHTFVCPLYPHYVPMSVAFIPHLFPGGCLTAGSDYGWRSLRRRNSEGRTDLDGKIMLWPEIPVISTKKPHLWNYNPVFNHLYPFIIGKRPQLWGCRIGMEDFKKAPIIHAWKWDNHGKL